MAERVQVEDLAAPERIRRSASAVDTYYRPAEGQVAKPETQRWATDLAEGLEAIQPSVNRFAAARHKEYTEEELRKGAEARQRNQASFKEAIDKGLIPAGASPWFKKGFEQQAGRLAGSDLYGAGLNNAWANSPVRNSDNPKDYADFVADYRKEFLNEHQGAAANPDWFEGFAPMMNRAENNLGQHHISHRQREIERKVDDQTYQEATSKIRDFRDWSRLSTPEGKQVGLSNLSKDFTLWAKHQIAMGQSGSRVNELLTLAIDAEAQNSRDKDIYRIGDSVQTGSGTLSGTRAYKERRISGEQRIDDHDWNETTRGWQRADRDYTLDSQKNAREGWEWAKKQQTHTLAEQARADFIRLKQGEMGMEIYLNPDKPLDQIALARLARANPAAADALIGYQKHILASREYIAPNNLAITSILADMQRDPDTFDMSRVFNGPKAGQFDASWSVTLLNQYKSIQDHSAKDPILKDPIFKERHSGIVSAIQFDPEGKITGASSANSREAAVRFYTAVRDFGVENPKASESAKHDFMAKKYYELIQEFNPYAAEHTKLIRDGRAKQAAEEALNQEESTRHGKVSSDVVPPAILRAYREAVSNMDLQAQRDILKDYPQIMGGSKKTKGKK